MYHEQELIKKKIIGPGLNFTYEFDVCFSQGEGNFSVKFKEKWNPQITVVVREKFSGPLLGLQIGSSVPHKVICTA